MCQSAQLSVSVTHSTWDRHLPERKNFHKQWRRSSWHLHSEPALQQRFNLHMFNMRLNNSSLRWERENLSLKLSNWIRSLISPSFFSRSSFCFPHASIIFQFTLKYSILWYQVRQNLRFSRRRSWAIQKLSPYSSTHWATQQRGDGLCHTRHHQVRWP